MKVKFEHDRLEMITEDDNEKRFVQEMSELIQAVSNELMAWYGDVKFDGKETSGNVITWKPKRNPRNIGIEKSN